MANQPFRSIMYLAHTFQLALQSFSSNLSQKVLCIIDSIFELIEPLFHSWISDFFFLCIIEHCVKGKTRRLQLLQQCIRDFSSPDEVQNLSRCQSVKQHAKGCIQNCSSHQGLSHVFLLAINGKKLDKNNYSKLKEISLLLCGVKARALLT